MARRCRAEWQVRDLLPQDLYSKEVEPWVRLSHMHESSLYRVDWESKLYVKNTILVERYLSNRTLPGSLK